MGFKHFVGTSIDKVVEGLITWNYKCVPFIPNGRILPLDLKRALIAPKVIFDVGGNEGQTANYFAKHFTNADIYSFEPVLSAYQKMVGYVHSPRVKCFHQGLGNEKTDLVIYKSSSYTGVSSINGKENNILSEQETITVTTGIDVCSEYQITTIDLLKIDTEGYEINVLNGFKPMLTSGVKFIYIETSFDANNTCQTYITKLLEYLYPLGFIVSGFYSPHRKGFAKLKLDHCDMLLTNTALVKI